MNNVYWFLLVVGYAIAAAAAPQPGAKLWEFSAGQSVQSSPAVGADGPIYIGSDNGKLYALTPEGDKKWEFSAGGNIVCAPAIGADGTIYFGSVDRNLYALHPNGTEKWRTGTGAGIVSSPAIGADGTVYVGSVFNQLVAIGPDGKKKWEFQVGGNVISSPAIGVDGTIYFGSFNDKFYAVSPNGTRKWDFTTGGKINSSPAIGTDGTIYFGSFDGRLYALNPAGTRKWFYAAEGAIRSSPIIGEDGTIYFGSDDRKFYALSPDGGQKWAFTAGEWIRSSPALAADGTLYFGCYDQNLYALSPEGTKLWSFAAGYHISSSPAIGADGTVFFGSWDGKIYAVKGTAPLAAGIWPKFRGHATHAALAGGGVGTPVVNPLVNKPVTVPTPATVVAPATPVLPAEKQGLLRVDIIGAGQVNPPLNGQMLDMGKTYTLRADPTKDTQFAGWTGGITTNTTELQFVMRPNLVLQANFAPRVDRTPPTLTITSPLENTHVPNPVFNVRGTAADNVGVARVLYHFGDGEFKPAEGTANWSVRRVAVPGTNTIHVKCVDLAGNESPVLSRNFQFVVLSHFKLEMRGSGTVTPALGGKMLEIGKSYSLSAEPKKDYIFSGWSGGLEASTPKITFLMRSNFLLRANFIPLPFQNVQGSYRGLFFETNGVAPESSGFFALNVTAQGVFNGSFHFAGSAYPLSGRLAPDGLIRQTLPRRGKTPLVVDMRLDPKGQNDQITGQVTDGDLTSAFLGDRDVFDGKTRKAPQAGRYTLIIPGATNSAASPGGDGFGAVSVDTSGNVRFTGELADGAQVTQEATLSRDGVWPFYAPLYGGRGVLLGWIKFPPAGTGDLYGKLNWVKPPVSGDHYYPNGFARTISVFGSTYTPPPSGVKIVDAIAAMSSVVRGGNIDEILLPADQFKVNLNSANGLFNGTFIHPQTRKSVSFKGAYVQKQNWRSGYFLGGNESGYIFFGVPQ